MCHLARDGKPLCGLGSDGLVAADIAPVPDVPWSFPPMPTKSAEAPHIRRLSEPKYVKCTESGNYKAVVKALSRAVTSGMLPKGWVFVEGFPSLPLPGIFGPSLLHRDPFFPAPDAQKSSPSFPLPTPRSHKSGPSFPIPESESHALLSVDKALRREVTIHKQTLAAAKKPH